MERCLSPPPFATQPEGASRPEGEGRSWQSAADGSGALIFWDSPGGGEEARLAAGLVDDGEDLVISRHEDSQKRNLRPFCLPPRAAGLGLLQSIGSREWVSGAAAPSELVARPVEPIQNVCNHAGDGYLV